MRCSATTRQPTVHQPDQRQQHRQRRPLRGKQRATLHGNPEERLRGRVRDRARSGEENTSWWLLDTWATGLYQPPGRASSSRNKGDVEQAFGARATKGQQVARGHRSLDWPPDRRFRARLEIVPDPLVQLLVRSVQRVVVPGGLPIAGPPPAGAAFSNPVVNTGVQGRQDDAVGGHTLAGGPSARCKPASACTTADVPATHVHPGHPEELYGGTGCLDLPAGPFRRTGAARSQFPFHFSFFFSRRTPFLFFFLPLRISQSSAS